MTFNRKPFFASAVLVIISFIGIGSLQAIPPAIQQKILREDSNAKALGEPIQKESFEKEHLEDPSLHETIDRRHKFSKKFQSEFGILGGDFLGDEWHNTWNAGGRYYLHFNDVFAVGAAYIYSPIVTDEASAFGASLKTKNTHTITCEIMINNDCAFRAGDSIIECDLFLAFGMGAMSINQTWEPTGMIGGGIKVYTPAPWLAFRFDVNSYMHPTPNPLKDTFNADIAMNGGISFLVPVRKIGESK